MSWPPAAPRPASQPTLVPRAIGAEVKFNEIVRYVMRKLRITETKAAFHVSQVLKAGIEMRRIQKTPSGRYRLLHTKPVGLFSRVSNDEDDWSSSNSE